MSTTLDNSTETLFRELDYRETNGVEVSLLWNAHTDAISVHVFDTRTSQTFEATVASASAREAFLHPFTFVLERTEAQ